MTDFGCQPIVREKSGLQGSEFESLKSEVHPASTCSALTSERCCTPAWMSLPGVPGFGGDSPASVHLFDPPAALGDGAGPLGGLCVLGAGLGLAKGRRHVSLQLHDGR